MHYRFIDNQGTFEVKNPGTLNTYFPLTDKEGKILSAIAPNLAGDIKLDNEHFITPPASIEDLRNNLLCRRNFFIATKNGITALGQNAQKLQAGLLYHKLFAQTQEFNAETLTFVPHNAPVEITQVTVTNKTKKPLAVTLTAFMPLYGRGEKNLRDHRHVSSLLNRVTLSVDGIILKPTMIFDENGHQENKMQYFCFAREGNGKTFLGQFPTLDYFCGNGNLDRPDAVYKKVKPATKNMPAFNGKECCGAFRFKTKILSLGETGTFITITGAHENSQTINDYLNLFNTRAKVENALNETKKYWLNYLSHLDFNFGDKNFDGWLKWVKLQPVLRKLFGCSFLPHFDYGKGGRGWRDLWQDALTLLLTEPAAAKELIVNSFKGVRIDGTNATIITKNNSFLSDRNKIARVWMDHGVWPYLTLRSYINRTGDINILLENLPYYRDHMLRRAGEHDPSFTGENILRAISGEIYTGSILEHLLVQHLTAVFNVGEHNIIRLENADWNDGLDMAAQRGESVAFSFMYAHNLKDLCGMLRRLTTSEIELCEELAILVNSLLEPVSVEEKQNILNIYLEKTKNISGRKIKIGTAELISRLEEKVQTLFAWLNAHEWLKSGFFNGYYDNNGERVEGKKGRQLRMTLATQTLALMSNGVSLSRAKTIYRRVYKNLYDQKLGGFRLNTDFGEIYTALGRAFGFAYGEKENGAVFSHMAVMFAYALYKNNLCAEGWLALSSLYKMAQKTQAKIYPVLPEYFNSHGQGLYSYLTGSASWFIYTLLEETLGIKYVLGDLVIEPKLGPWNFNHQPINVAYYFAGKNIEVSFSAPKRAQGKPYILKTVLLNQKPMEINDAACCIKKSLWDKLARLDLKVVLG